MTKQREQKPRRVFSDEPVGFFPWLADQFYTFVYQEGDFALQFMGDLIRGPEPIREEKHLKRQMNFQQSRHVSSHAENSKSTAKNNEKPLTKAEQKIFVDLLRRKSSEPQIIYWKRKKALLNNPNKRGLVVQHQELQKHMAEQKNREPKIEVTNIARNYQKALSKKQTSKRPRKR